MVRPVDVLMAVHAGPSKHPVALLRCDGRVVVDRRRMLRRDVTALTEHRHAYVQHAIVRRAVRVVARRAVLAHRRVLPEHRSAHLGVTARAQLVDRTPDFQVLDVADRAVRIVARRARHLALADRHVRHRAFGLDDLLAMTGRAQLRLARLHQLVLERLRLVHAVTGRAREVSRFVGAAFPPRVTAAIVAGETGLAHLGRLERAESLDVSLRVVVDVCLPGTVAALAAECGRGRSRILRLPVARVLDALGLIVVTEDAGVSTGVAWR